MVERLAVTSRQTQYACGQYLANSTPGESKSGVSAALAVYVAQPGLPERDPVGQSGQSTSFAVCAWADAKRCTKGTRERRLGAKLVI